MWWIPGFSDKKKSQDCQQPVVPPPSQNPNTVLQVVVEETVMTAAKWLVTLINRSLEAKVATPAAETKTAVNVDQAKSANTDHTTASITPNSSDINQANTTEELLSKFSYLLEQSHDRIQSTTTLENRVRAIEVFLKRNNDLERQVKALSQSFAGLENRLAHVEDLVKQVDTAAIEKALEIEPQLEQKIEVSTQFITNLESRLSVVECFLERESPTLDTITKIDQNVAALENRINSMEKLIARLNIMRRFVENNYRSIASLRNQVKSLNPTPISNGHISHN